MLLILGFFFYVVLDFRFFFSKTVDQVKIICSSFRRQLSSVSNCMIYTQAPQYGDVRVTVEKIPNVVQLEEQFSVDLSITNIW